MVEWSKKCGYVFTVARFTNRTVSSSWSCRTRTSLIATKVITHDPELIKVHLCASGFCCMI